MARKQARRHKQKKPARFRLPTIRMSYLLAPFVAAGIVFGEDEVVVLEVVVHDRRLGGLR